MPVTPREVFDLIASGVEVTVERSNSRCFADKDYEAAGAVLTDKSWQSAPLSTVVLGLKELNESATPIAHTHIYFSHTFKGQDGAQHTLSRFFRGGGKIYDLEYFSIVVILLSRILIAGILLLFPGRNKTILFINLIHQFILFF